MHSSDNVRKMVFNKYVTLSSTLKPDLSEEDYSIFFTYTFLPRYSSHFSNLPKDAHILELGSGPGLMLNALRDYGFVNIRGVDLSPEQNELAKRRGLNVTHADLRDLLKECSGLDAVVAIDVIEHFHKWEVFELCELCHNALLPGGRLILQTVNGSGLFPHQIIYGDVTHNSVFTPASLKQTLSLMGFERLSFFETGPVGIGKKGKLRRSLWTCVKWIANMVRFVETGKHQELWTENMICVAYRVAD